MGETASATVALEINDHAEGRVAWVTLDNQAKLNAITPGIASSLVQIFSQLSEDGLLRAVVLTGAGERAFSAGADVAVMKTLDPASARTFIHGLHEAINAVRKCPVPVIARMRGYCFGGALELVAGCDMRIGDDTVVIGMPEVRVGIPSVIEAALLPYLVGWGKTREMLLLGGTYSARESAEMGMLQKLVPAKDLDGAVQQWIDQILANGARAVRSQKNLMAKWETLDLAQSVEAGIEHFAAAFESDEPARMLASALKSKASPG